MKAHTMRTTLSSLLGRPAYAIPLSSCRVVRRYLLERAGIPDGGTALLFTLPYVMAADAVLPSRNLSLYAVPRDYHHYVQKLSDTLIPAMETAHPGHRFALFADHSPIAEVDAASKAGLGVVGENGLLITPDYGSFVFIAALLTDADYPTATGEPPPAFPVDPPRCERCGACRRACPTGHLDGRGICLSELTQKKGALTPEEVAILQDHPLVWGCDACQVVCPHNRRILDAGVHTPIPYFQEAHLPFLTVERLAEMDDTAFAERAYAWRGRDVIRRNLAIAHKHTQEEEL